MNGALIVVKPGFFSTIQDGGRLGFLRYGVTTSGAFDPLLHAIAHRLAGNQTSEAAVEVTLKGDEFAIEGGTCRLAFAGDFTVLIDGKPSEPWRTYTLDPGQRISIGAANRGLRGYLAATGGFNLQSVLGSRSVHTRTGIGPFGGRILAAGDRLPLNSVSPAVPDRRFDTSRLPPRRTTLRVVLGPQDYFFAAEDIERFFGSEFEVTPRCDRMGYQFKGPGLEYRKDIPLISEGIALGSLQVLGHGIVVATLVDRQTTGGYPKIATIITPDVRELAHVGTGTKIRFEQVTVEKAQAIRLGFENEILRRIDDHFTDIRSELSTTERLFANNLISGVSTGQDL